MTRIQRLRHDTFAALANPNYRLYFGGQAISLIGTWMQTIAQSYLVFTLTHSAIDVGYVVAEPEFYRPGQDLGHTAVALHAFGI